MIKLETSTPTFLFITCILGVVSVSTELGRITAFSPKMGIQKKCLRGWGLGGSISLNNSTFCRHFKLCVSACYVKKSASSGVSGTYTVKDLSTNSYSCDQIY